MRIFSANLRVYSLGAVCLGKLKIILGKAIKSAFFGDKK
jgi:hypothetical protein